MAETSDKKTEQYVPYERSTFIHKPKKELQEIERSMIVQVKETYLRFINT